MAVEATAPLVPRGRKTLRRYLGDVFAATRIIAAVAIVAASGAWPATWHHLLALTILAVLTWPVRSVRWGTIFNLFVIGMVFALAIVALQWLIEGVILGQRFEVFRSAVIAPVTEEPLKVLPLVILLLFKRWPFRYGHGAVDLMICGMALGTGYGLFEDSLRRAADYPEAVSPRLFGIPVFLDSYNAFLGHGGAAAFIALAIGWAIWCSRRKVLLLVGPFLVVAVVYWMIVDHGLANYSNTSGVEWPPVIRWAWDLSRGGALAPYVLFGALLVTLIAERIALSLVLRPLPRISFREGWALLLAPLRLGLSYDSLRNSARRLRRLALYVLAMRQVGYLILHAKGDRPIDRESLRRLIAMRSAEIAVIQTAARQP